MRALVTGGAGFLGSHLVDRLLAEGHSVDVVDDLSGGSLAHLADARADVARLLRFHQLDVRSPDFDALLDLRRPEVVYHLAAARPGSEAAAIADVAVVGALRVLESARRSAGAKVVFALPAAAIYAEASPRQLPLKESHPQEPRSPAGVAGRAVLDALRYYRERRAVEFSALALGDVYGPRRAATGNLVATLAAGLVEAAPCPVPGDGRQTSDYLYVDDAIDALARSAARGSGLVCNVGTGQATSANALYGLLAAAAGVERRPDPAPEDPDVPRRFALDATRARIHLGWEPWTDLVDGAAATVDWWRRQAAGPGPVSGRGPRGTA